MTSQPLTAILSEDNDIAAVIVECNGAHYGTFPLQNPQFLQDLQDLAKRHGVLFIMDEVDNRLPSCPPVARKCAGDLNLISPRWRK